MGICYAEKILRALPEAARAAVSRLQTAGKAAALVHNLGSCCVVLLAALLYDRKF